MINSPAARPQIHHPAKLSLFLPAFLVELVSHAGLGMSRLHRGIKSAASSFFHVEPKPGEESLIHLIKGLQQNPMPPTIRGNTLVKLGALPPGLVVGPARYNEKSTF